MDTKMSIRDTISHSKSRILNTVPVNDKGVHVTFEESEVGVAEVDFWVDHTIDYVIPPVIVNADFVLDK